MECGRIAVIMLWDNIILFPCIRIINMRMKLLITIVFNFILLVSAYALFALIARPETQNDDTSDLRFKFMLALHLLFFIAMLIQLKLDETYDLMLLVFSVVVITATALFICEEKVQRVQRSPGYNYSHLDFESQPLQLTYLKLYFSLYTSALLGLVCCIFFLVVTEGLVFSSERNMENLRSRCLRMASGIGLGGDCSICLGGLADGRKCMQIINCGHLFHDECLIKWIRYHTTCPLDRRDIFDSLQDSQMEGVVD